jgi:hypothetical protein
MRVDVKLNVVAALHTVAQLSLESFDIIGVAGRGVRPHRADIGEKRRRRLRPVQCLQ